MRDQLDSLLDEAARREMTLREALAFVCEREVARRDERRVEMAVKIAHFPFVRDLQGFDFAAQPSLDPKQVVDVRALVRRRWRTATSDQELRLYLGILAVASVALVAELWTDGLAEGEAAIRHGVFQVVSITTTTGFASADFAGWATFGLMLLLALMMTACSHEAGDALSPRQAAQLVRGDAARGRVALRQYGCGACHTVPGVVGADGLVGPPLAGIGGRAYIAGVLTNTPEHLVLWIVNPRGVDSLTAMPITGVGSMSAPRDSL